MSLVYRKLLTRVRRSHDLAASWLRGHLLCCLLLTAFVAGATTFQESAAGEWPQILGPNRNGVAANETLAERWPKGGPKLLWQRDVGRGFSGVAVAGGAVVLFHRVGDEEVAEAMDPKTGERQWKQAFPVRYESSISSDDGPRATPVINDNHVYLLGVTSNLYCLRLKDGEKRWSRQLGKEFEIPPSYFGAGTTPLVENDKLLVNVGGRNGAGIVAVKLSDGHNAWKATEEAASYSSPVSATIDGTRHAIFVTRLSVVSLDPDDGRVRWKLPFGQRGPTVNAATPLVIDGHVFLSASYGIGAVWAKVKSDSVDVVWSSDEIMSSQYTTCVHSNGVLFGIDGRQDVPPARLRAFDPKSKKAVWTQEDYGTGNLILAGDKLVILKTDGKLVLVRTSQERYEELARAQVLDGTAQALPSLANGLLYVRDERVLKCFDLR
jgi:outer membrane protein assembly factor BamB